MKATHSYWVPNTRHAGHWEERAKRDPISPHEELQGRHRNNNKCSNGIYPVFPHRCKVLFMEISCRSSDILMSEWYMHNKHYSAVVFSLVLSRVPVVEFYVRLEFWPCISLVSVRGWDVDTGWVDGLICQPVLLPGVECLKADTAGAPGEQECSCQNSIATQELRNSLFTFKFYVTSTSGWLAHRDCPQN